MARDARDWRRAADNYQRFLTHRPGDFAIWVQLGHMLSEVGDLAGADKAYRTAHDLDPDNADLALCRGHLAKRSGDIEGAAAFYRRSREIDGNDQAERALAELDGVDVPASVEPVAVAGGEEAASPFGGRIEGWYERSISGVVHAGPIPDAWIEFRAGDRLVAQVTPSLRDDGAMEFRATLDIEAGDDGAGVVVTGRRMPDGAPLDPPIVELHPPSRHPADHPPAWSVAAQIVKPLTLPAGGEIALFVTHSRTGKVKPHVLPYVRALKKAGIGVFLIATVDRPFDLPIELFDLADAVMVRRNAGYDFGAWAHALKLHPELYGASTLYLTNDSVLPAIDDARIAALVERVRASAADLVGLTESHEWRWHVQSYFLAIKPRLLGSRAFHGFMDDVRLLTRKDHVIRAYEVRLGEIAEQSGHGVEILYPSAVAINPTLFGWRGLIADGLPLVKLLLLRGQFSKVDTSGWKEELAAAGFDVDLAEAVITLAAEEGPVDDGGRLLARRMPEVADSGRLKVAFFGPWNYDNGLGAASRGIIAALRRTGVRLNLHPIKKAFHVHKQLVPPVDILDFEGQPDVAIVHLNPDSWHLLTDDQRGAIAQARRRIGYWVWEMGHIPPAWRQNFGSVDRIWAPSRYCADLFGAQGSVPVDVVPHVVPIAEPAPLDRATALERIGLPADRRTILYVFDGSSYLVRKNPAALVRAFSASGLADRGWSLVLKTKHLLDRPEEGEAFRALANGTPGVVLIDRAMAADELAELVALADVYASPHCSEGFGLTIAEAMAAGKPVVATDFGGSRDFLDAAVGWPVKAHAWRLDQDFGHYTEGGEWGRIDEPALAATLAEAAEAIDAGDHRKGDSARRRVDEMLSYTAVAARIDDSLTALRGMTGDSRGASFQLNLSAGLPVERVVFGPGLTAVVLAPDGTLDTELPADLPTGRDDWILFAPRESRLSPMFEREWREAVDARPDAGIFYGDDVAADEDRAVNQLRLKPAFDLTLLAAQDYIGAPLIIRASLLAELGLVAEAGAALLDDLLLRAHHAGAAILRIPKVLLAHPGARPKTDPTVRKAMLERQPLFAHHRFFPGRAAGTLTQDRRFGDHPPVSLLIPTRRSTLPGTRTSYVERLLKAIADADWPMDRLTVIVGDDVAGEPAWARRAWPFKLRRIETLRGTDQPFNYAAKMNLLWRAAETEQIVMMNDDLLPVDGGWLKALVGFTMDDSVGGVGGHLLYADGKLQHAGIAPLFGAIAHAWATRDDSRGTYQDWALVQREWSAVTGALFATRRSVMERIDGFDEQFSLEFNDIDMCLRIRAAGLRILCTPAAEMVHAERASRGDMAVAGDQYAAFHQRWTGWLNDDPSWHPGLDRHSFEVKPIDDRDAWYR